MNDHVGGLNIRAARSTLLIKGKWDRGFAALGLDLAVRFTARLETHRLDVPLAHVLTLVNQPP